MADSLEVSTKRRKIMSASMSKANTTKRRIGFGPLGNIAFSICALYVVAAIVGPIFFSHRADLIGNGTPFLRPSGKFWFGTDDLGRDEISRIIVASRIAILVSVESVAFAAIVGTIVGVIAGYVGGVVDELLSRFLDLLFSVPSYLLGIVVIVALGGGLTHAALAIGLVFTPQFGRIARAGTIEIKKRAYVESARLSNRSPFWILSRHVLPNIMTPLSVMIGVTLANAEGAYAVLSYLGFGATPPAPDFGSMLSEGQQYLTSDPWLIFFPSAALVLLIFGFVLLGDWIRESVDPTAKVWVGGGAASEALDGR